MQLQQQLLLLVFLPLLFFVVVVEEGKGILVCKCGGISPKILLVTPCDLGVRVGCMQNAEVHVLPICPCDVR